MARLRDILRGWGPAETQNILKRDSWSVLGCVQPRSPFMRQSPVFRPKMHCGGMPSGFVENNSGNQNGAINSYK
mgnify:CR=1 FL=1